MSEGNPREISKVEVVEEVVEKDTPARRLEKRLGTLMGKVVVGFELDNSGGVTIKFEGGIELNFVSCNADDEPYYDGVGVNTEE